MNSFLDDIIDPDKAQKYIVQGTEEWERIRVGRFTASRMNDLMASGKRPMTEAELKARPKTGVGSAAKLTDDPTIVSKGAESYIREKVTEVLTGRVRQTGYAFPLVWGKDTEPLAIEYFVDKTGYHWESCGFYPFTDHAGGSPDGLINEDDIIEVKCPEDSSNQVLYLGMTDHFDILSHHPEYYWQCQSNLLFTGKKQCHFVTFDPRMIQDKHKMQHIIIPAHEAHQKLIIMKIEAAVEQKLKMLKELL